MRDRHTDESVDRSQSRRARSFVSCPFAMLGRTAGLALRTNAGDGQQVARSHERRTEPIVKQWPVVAALRRVVTVAGVAYAAGKKEAAEMMAADTEECLVLQTGVGKLERGDPR